MSSVPPETLLTQLKWRYATKKFDSARKIAPDLWSKLEDAVMLAPSSYGLQPWKFFVITDPAVRTKLHTASYGQSQILDASHLVVFAVKKSMGPGDAERLVNRAAQVRGVPAESLKDYQQRIAGSLSSKTTDDVDAWMSRQVYIALGVFLTSAALFGVDACPMEGFDSQRYDEILELTGKGYSAVVLATAGYRSPDDKYALAAKVRFDRAEVIEHI